ncbi:MAG: Hsp70 family protein [Bacteroidales bacterium]|nr:Hsp70 family protein [Bacteroidales bacterium]
MQDKKIIGVDFGSSQTSIALMSIGSTQSPVLVKGSNGRKTIPTLLAVDENDTEDVIAWGNEVAKRYKQKNIEGILFPTDFKRYLRVEEQSDEKIPDEQKKANVYCKLYIRKLADFLKEKEGVDKLEPSEYVTCIAHPAAWTEEQVLLLKKYFTEAGFPADPVYGIYTIPEPIAAMHSLRVDESVQNFQFDSKPEYFIVIDFGGGTLDVCVVRTDILGQEPKIVSKAGKTLGGHDFDIIVANLFFDKYPEVRDGLPREEMAELKERFKEAKEVYADNFIHSENATYTFHIPSGDFPLSVEKTTFENKCDDKKIFDTIKSCIVEALEKANIQNSDIKKVVLTGGSSKWYFVKEIVLHEFSINGNNIFITPSPFTDVATGCAVYKGRDSEPPVRPGVWFQWRINGGKWSKITQLLAPSRDKVIEIGESAFITDSLRTSYFIPYRIDIKFASALAEDKLKDWTEEASFEYFARSNRPILGRFVRALQAGVQNKNTNRLEDKYKVFISCKDIPGITRQFKFEIFDAQAALYEEIKRTKGEKEAENHPKGYVERASFEIGDVSRRSWFGWGTRKKTSQQGE